ncbi:MAG: PAS domain S-box protein [Spirochaetes bacterium]|nr:PAS domain S-box protein [Spirochaetota bacterium]
MANARILVAEDDAISGKYIQKTLQDNGYDVPAVLMAGEELVDNIHTINPDLILMDIKLQGDSDGIDTARHILSQYDVPVIYMTAHVDPDTVGRAKTTNPYGYLVKPFNMNELIIAIDFTLYRHQMEKKLKKTQERYRAIVESMPLMICRFLPGDSVITFVNDEYCRYFNLRREDLLGTSFLDRMPEYERDRIGGHHLTLSREKPLLNYECGVPGPAGERWQHWTVQALYDDMDNLAEYQAIGRDITESMRAKEAIRVSEEKFSRAFHSSPAGMAIILLKDGTFIDVNLNFARISGFNRDELLGTPITSLEIYTAPDDRQAITDAIEKKGVVHDHEIHVKTRTGDLRTVIVSAEIIQVADNRCLLVVARDITERLLIEETLRRSERQYRLLADNMFDLVGMCDVNANFTYVSPSYGTALGYSEKELLGRPIYCLVHPDDLPGVLATIKANRYSGNKVVAVYRMIHKDGRVLWFESNGKVVSRDNGVVMGAVFSSREISDRKVIEDSLRMAQRQLMEIIDFFPDATFVIDKEKKVITWNRAMEKMTGVPEEAMLGKGDYEYAIPFFGERRPILIDLVGEEVPRNNGHYLTFSSDGDSIIAESYIPSLPFTMKETYLWGKASPLYDGHGAIIGAIEIIRDITEIKRIEMALRESEEKFRHLFEESADAQFLIDDKRIIDCNVAAINLFSAGRKEVLLGKSPHELSPEFLPDGTLTELRMNEIMKFVFEMDSLSFEWVHLCFDGRQAPVDITFTVVPIAGKLMIHAVLKDITLRKLAQEALRKSEERYRVLVETMSDGLVQGDGAGTITFVNDRFCEMVGALKDDIIGNSILNLIHEDDRENFMEQVRGKESLRKSAFEIKLKSKSDGNIDAIVSPRPLIDDRGHIAGIVAVFTDITERKYLERQALEISMKEQQRIGRDLHDDLGQILTGTGFLCESLVRKLSNRSLPEAEDARGVFALINEAKDHTRMLSRGLSPMEIDSGGIVAALERFARTVEGIYSVSFTLNIDPAITINDSMVETQFHYIVQESVTNAIKHGKANTIAVTLNKNKGRIHVSITDDGIGIPSDIDSHKGMGLRIMHYRANAIGASLKITKNRGRGTTVSCIWR